MLNKIYEENNITIYNNDCLDVMKTFSDKQIGVTVTSPPYNMNLRIMNGKYCSRQIVKEFSTKYDGFDDNMPIDDFYNFHKSVLSELIRVSRIIFYNFQIVTGSKRAFFKLIGDFNEQIKDVIIWDKINSQPAMQEDVMNSQFEVILILGDNPISRKFTVSNFDRGTLSNVWNVKRGKKTAQSHGAVFPEELVHKILSNFASKDETVFDPFMGSGTTLYTAKNMGMKAIGVDIIKNYCDISANRLQTLF